MTTEVHGNAAQLAELIEHRRGTQASDLSKGLSLVRSSAEEVKASILAAPVRDFASADESARADNARRHATWKKFLGDTSRDPRLENFIAETERQKAVIAALSEYVNDIAGRKSRGEGLLFYGPPGTGKDHLACSVIRKAIAADHTVRRVNGVDFFGDVRDLMDDDAKQSEAEYIDSLSRPDWLLLSDPLPPKTVDDRKPVTDDGKVNLKLTPLTPHQAAMLYRLIERRNWSRRPTIVTVNVASGDECEMRMGSATTDRIKDCSWVIPCNWLTHRKPLRTV